MAAAPDSTTKGFPPIDYFPFERVLRQFQASDDAYEFSPNLLRQIEEEVDFIWSLISEYERDGTLPEDENTYYEGMTPWQKYFVDTRCTPSVAVMCLALIDDEVVVQRDRTVEKDLAELKRIALKFSAQYLNS